MKNLSIIFLMIIAASCVTRKEAIDYISDSRAIKIDVRIKGDYTKSNPHSAIGDPLAFNAGDRVFVTSEDGTITYEYRKGEWSPVDNYYFRWGSEGLAFHASYPAIAGSDYLNFTLPSNQSTAEKISYADYMTCDIDAIHNDGTGLLRFEMERRTAKVVYTLVSVEEGETVKGFKINSPIGIVNGESTDETIMITPFVEVPLDGVRGGNGTKYIALVVPSDEKMAEEQITMVYKNAPLSFKVLPSREAGKQYEYQVKVEGDAVTISDPVVSDWTEGEIPGGDATPNRRFHWFVKPDGTGDGSSWENAMGPATLREMLATTGEDKERAALYDKTHFHFAGGSYVLADGDGAALKIEYSGYASLVNISWDGGYNPASTSTSLEDRDIAAYETIFSGEGTYPILQLGNQTALSFNGITFSNANSTGKGAAIFQAPGNSGNSSIQAEDCAFLSNKGSTGAAISSNKGDVACINCTFNGNEVSGDGGAILFGGSNLTLDGCVFLANVSGNVSHSTNDSSTGKGGALYLHASTAPVVKITRCLFDSNHSGIIDGTDAREYGGVLAMKNADVEAVECVFTGNQGNRGSVVMMLASSGGLFKADRCSFYGNKQYGRGVLYILSKNAAMLNSCAFYANDQRGNSGTWGEQIHAGGTTAICINNCSFNSTKTGYTSNVAGINTDGALLLINSTAVGQYPSGVGRGGNYSVANNIVVNRNASLKAFNCDYLYCKYNATSATPGGNYTPDETNIFTMTPSDLTWSEDASTFYKSCFTWSGVLDNFTRAKIEDVTAAFESFDVNASSWGGVLKTVSNVGSAFKLWLEGMTPVGYTVDQRGATRDTSGLWPGSYED